MVQYTHTSVQGHWDMTGSSRLGLGDNKIDIKSVDVWACWGGVLLFLINFRGG